MAAMKKGLHFCSLSVIKRFQANAMTNKKFKKALFSGAWLVVVMGTILTITTLLAPFALSEFTLPKSIYLMFLGVLPCEIALILSWWKASHGPRPHLKDVDSVRIQDMFRFPH
jgi:hypothetical protein